MPELCCRRACREALVGTQLRQARLRRECAPWYPIIGVAAWVPAKSAANAVRRQLIGGEPLRRPGGLPVLACSMTATSCFEAGRTTTPLNVPGRGIPRSHTGYPGQPVVPHRQPPHTNPPNVVQPDVT
jgi:hypothetical protein